MVLSNISEDMAETHPGLGGVGEAVIPRFVELAKGRAYDRDAHRFYNLFVNSTKYVHKPDDMHAARAYMQGAWWIEDEDIRQFLYSVLLMRRFGDGRTVAILAAYLVMYLFSQDVFSRQSGWEELYPTPEVSYEMEGPEAHVPVLFDKRISDSTYDRYLLYCVSMGYTISQVATLTNRSRRQIHNELARIRKEF